MRHRTERFHRTVILRAKDLRNEPLPSSPPVSRGSEILYFCMIYQAHSVKRKSERWPRLAL